MRRFGALVVSLLMSSMGVATGVIAAMLLISCGASKARRAEIEQGVSTFVADWNRNDLDKIYESACPSFRESRPRNTLPEYADFIRKRRGALRNVQITEVTKIPAREFYTVHTSMTYDNGRTSGMFIFNEERGQLCLSAVNLEDLTQPVPTR